MRLSYMPHRIERLFGRLRCLEAEKHLRVSTLLRGNVEVEGWRVQSRCTCPALLLGASITIELDSILIHLTSTPPFIPFILFVVSSFPPLMLATARPLLCIDKRPPCRRVHLHAPVHAAHSSLYHRHARPRVWSLTPRLYNTTHVSMCSSCIKACTRVRNQYPIQVIQFPVLEVLRPASDSSTRTCTISNSSLSRTRAISNSSLFCRLLGPDSQLVMISRRSRTRISDHDYATISGSTLLSSPFVHLFPPGSISPQLAPSIHYS